MTRKEIETQYKTNERGLITSPGKFENEMIYVPYFYDFILDGCSDETEDDEGGTPIDYFDITPEDLGQFPELKGIKRISIQTDDQGFVWCYSEA